MAPMPTSDDYYLILEVESSATAEEITQSYRRLALKLHPDRNDRPNATQAFQKLGQAYETLKDDDERRKYDRLRRFRDTTPTPWTSARRQQADPWSQAREEEARQREAFRRAFRDMEARYEAFWRDQDDFMEQARQARAEARARADAKAKATAETMRQRRQAEEKQRQREKEEEEQRCRHGGGGWWPKVTSRGPCGKCGGEEEEYLLQCPDCDMRVCAKCQCELRPKMEPKKWKKAKKSKKTK
ncbi:unnamed protein product [Zymoseptoria tritici ST99CH_1A5]|uniref:J domain-containing protein n=1 Tax=Zymoseptoria tritici ST99CH_1A5 TaxID=1276529 RepID=A0A1Y6M0M4_ZYMTR|nr:unnamed protein product [Zymoseptoria tritici ST99CH_1A5]